ncbi:phosphotransferase family protein [Nemania sp. FL0916]|nr:phosphotransferase family protein [Nemania sp. FL0916]
MPPKPRFLCTDKDDLIWEKLDEATDEWDISTRTNETYNAVAELILKYKAGQAEVIHPPIKGGYNVVYRLEYKDGSSAIMRIPIKGIVTSPEEKIRYEVATMRYVAVNTTIPVPYVYYYGTAGENLTGLGPFIIMEYIEHYQNMSRFLFDPSPNILFQLSFLKFPRIGSLVENEGKDSGTSISVSGRPLIVNMNDIVVHTNAPAKDEDDARDKYMARLLFRKLAAERRLAPESEPDDDCFMLFSEDFRPANILLDKDLQVVVVIDWEFAYAAPAQFSYDPPWWLLLEEPEDWPGGYRAWMQVYEPRLRTFLRLLEAEENKLAANKNEKDNNDMADQFNDMSLTSGREIGTDAPSPRLRLSQCMRSSWDTRAWMRNYAARKSWAFDFVWWKFLDESYFGPNEDQDYQARLGLLSESQREAMEAFVACKMEERRNPGIVEWTEKQAADRLAEVFTKMLPELIDSTGEINRV